MNRPSFLEGALVALAAALAASVLDTILRLVLWPAPALTLTIAALGLGYLLYLVGRSGERTGRVLPVIAWVPVTAAALALWPVPWVQVLVQLGCCWAVRVWHFQGTPGAALLDLILVLTGAAAALWAAVHTGSLFLAIWCLFLVQATFGVIPHRPALRTGRYGLSQGSVDPFDVAARAAEGALGRLRDPV